MATVPARQHLYPYHSTHALLRYLFLGSSRVTKPFSHGLLPQFEQGEKLSQSHFLGRYYRTCRAMQRLPARMFQEVQRKREGKDEAGTGRTGPSAERGQRMGADTSPEACEAPIRFTTPVFTKGPSRAPPLFLEADTPPPSSRVKEPSPSRGRTLGTGRSRDRRPSDPSQDSHVRSDHGPGKVRAAWWESSTEEVPLRLIGGYSGTNAISSTENSSQEQSRKSSIPSQQPPDDWDTGPSDFKHLKQGAANSHGESISGGQATAIFNIKTFGASPETPSSSSSAQSSAASSFAYQLRRRVDMRLLRKRDKPAQHTKRKSVEKPNLSPPLRSPTYGAPKVVEDSRDEPLPSQLDDRTYNSIQAFIDKSSKVAVTSLKLPPPKQTRSSPSNPSEEQKMDSAAKKDAPSPGPTKAKRSGPRRPGILRSSPSRDINELSDSPNTRPRSAFFSRSSSRESPVRVPSPLALNRKHQASSSSRTSPLSLQVGEPMVSTPGSNDTGKSETNPFQTDENYFSTLRTKMTDRRAFTPTLSPAEPDRPLPSPIDPPSSPQHEHQQETWPVMSTEAIERRRKRGSIFSVFGLPVPGKVATPVLPDLFAEPSPDRPTIPTLATWPKGSVNDARAQWRRMSEDPKIPQYFARRRRTHTSSDISPTPALSTESTSFVSGDHPTSPREDNVQEDSDEIGPLSLFTPLPPLREDYDRSRHVSIEIPGTPGVHHHPLDTPHPSPLIDTNGSSGVAIIANTTNQKGPVTSLGSIITRKLSLQPSPPIDQQATDTSPEIPTIRKRPSVLEDIASELRGTPNRRKSSSRGDRPVRLLQRRRSAIAPITRKATVTSIASGSIKPVKRSMTPFKKPRQETITLSSNPKE